MIHEALIECLLKIKLGSDSDLTTLTIRIARAIEDYNYQSKSSGETDGI